MPSLRLNNIRKKYDPKNPYILHITQLEVMEGEFFALLGPSGCGKTTLLKVIAGLITPEEGDVYLGEERITEIPAEKRGFGMVFQQPLLFPHMTVEENVAFGLKMKGWPKPERLEKARDLLSQVGLSGYGHRHPMELSGGQQQRVSLIRALITKPQLILLDEPFSAIDPELREEMRELVRNMQREFGVTMVLVTHDRDEAFLLADRIALMKDGRILQSGRPQELYERALHPEVAVFLGNRNLIRGELLHGRFVSPHLPGEWDLPGNGDSHRGWLVVRPESVKAMARESEEHRLPENIYIPAIIKQMSFVKGFSHLKAESGSCLLDVVLPAFEAARWQPGDQVTLVCSKGQLHFIPETEPDERRDGDA